MAAMRFARFGRREQRLLLLALTTVLPVFLYHFAAVVLPTLRTIGLSFTNWNGLATKDFIGLANYAELFRDANFYGAFANNLQWMAIFLTVPILLALVVGYTLSMLKSGRMFFRTAFFLPYVISAAIAGKIFVVLYNPYFGINGLFHALGLDYLARDWLAPANALVSVAIVDLWHWWGFLLVIFLSALQQIDPMLYESAKVEGANELQKLFYITIPSIRPTLVFIILVTMVWSISTFDYVWVMTRGSPGSELLSTLLYKNAYTKYRAGYAASIAAVQMAVSFLIFFLFGGLRKKLEDTL
jgi:raffinose/stachyose/melibiose transport system permease protein